MTHSAVKNHPSPVWFPVESTLLKNKKEIREAVLGRCTLKNRLKIFITMILQKDYNILQIGKTA